MMEAIAVASTSTDDGGGAMTVVARESGAWCGDAVTRELAWGALAALAAAEEELKAKEEEEQEGEGERDGVGSSAATVLPSGEGEAAAAAAAASAKEKGQKQKQKQKQKKDLAEFLRRRLVRWLRGLRARDRPTAKAVAEVASAPGAARDPSRKPVPPPSSWKKAGGVANRFALAALVRGAPTDAWWRRVPLSPRETKAAERRCREREKKQRQRQRQRQRPRQRQRQRRQQRGGQGRRGDGNGYNDDDGDDDDGEEDDEVNDDDDDDDDDDGPLVALGEALPLAFALVDDFETEHQLLGLSVLLRLVRCATPAAIGFYAALVDEVLTRALSVLRTLPSDDFGYGRGGGTLFRSSKGNANAMALRGGALPTVGSAEHSLNVGPVSVGLHLAFACQVRLLATLPKTLAPTPAAVLGGRGPSSSSSSSSSSNGGGGTPTMMQQQAKALLQRRHRALNAAMGRMERARGDADLLATLGPLPPLLCQLCPGLQLWVEPGRYLVAEAGVIL